MILYVCSTILTERKSSEWVYFIWIRKSEFGIRKRCDWRRSICFDMWRLRIANHTVSHYFSSSLRQSQRFRIPNSDFRIQIKYTQWKRRTFGTISLTWSLEWIFVLGVFHLNSEIGNRKLCDWRRSICFDMCANHTVSQNSPSSLHQSERFRIPISDFRIQMKYTQFLLFNF